jgi:hypothetical protein
METRYLINHKFRKIGAILFVLGLLAGIFAISDYEPEILDVQVLMLFADDEIFSEVDSQLIDIREENIFNELAGLMVIIGGLILLLSKRQIEDELIMKLRLESILWAAKINAFILIFGMLFIYGLNYYFVMVFNIILLYLLFALRFEWVVAQLKKTE